ncbi:hypothetical protein CEXT_439951 [Caerostris extrusa]|uniref:Uncharacterized protein n=1 Tax=Caerostris extrusa TaxID=172846 RepID=A0AAV4N585_CAEEX|nr:hypothetical protein CEXT_439951 [Caerostris extrusa]
MSAGLGIYQETLYKQFGKHPLEMLFFFILPSSAFAYGKSSKNVAILIRKCFNTIYLCSISVYNCFQILIADCDHDNHLQKIYFIDFFHSLF